MLTLLSEKGRFRRLFGIASTAMVEVLTPEQVVTLSNNIPPVML